MKNIPVKYHFLFWVGLIIMTTATLSPYYLNLFKATMHRVVFIPVWLIATYTTLLVLMPRLWDKGKKWTFVMVLVVLILVSTTVQRIFCIQFIYPKYFWMRPPNSDELDPFWIGPFVQFAGFIALPILLAMGIRQAWKWYEESYKVKEKVAEQQQAELKYLKAQVNPHFLFNTLNNLYGLSLESSEKVPEMILKLSDLLSYSLYESNVNSVSIKKEMELVSNFVALEKERYEDRVDVHYNIDASLNLEQHIAPLIILPLVENAFKHGITPSVSKTRVDISLNEKGGDLKLVVKNPIAKMMSEASEDFKGGVGLKNLRRRLELHYPDAHSLRIKSVNEQFIVELQVTLDE